MTAADPSKTVYPFEVNNRLVMSITVPVMLASVTTPLLGLVDTAVVGQFGDARLIGGLAISASVVLPMRRRLARAQRQGATTAPPSGS